MHASARATKAMRYYMYIFSYVNTTYTFDIYQTKSGMTVNQRVRKDVFFFLLLIKLFCGPRATRRERSPFSSTQHVNIDTLNIDLAYQRDCIELYHPPGCAHDRTKVFEVAMDRMYVMYVVYVCCAQSAQRIWNHASAWCSIEPSARLRSNTLLLLFGVPCAFVLALHHYIVYTYM